MKYSLAITGFVVGIAMLIQPFSMKTSADSSAGNKFIEMTIVETVREPEPLLEHIEAIPEPIKPLPVVVTKPAPKPVVAAPVAVTGTKTEWMSAAGIPESDWTYVDYIVSRESGWNPSAMNKSSGACGLVQALPCSKLGPNWSDPVTALKWQFNYVNARYGGYHGAYNFWVSNHWY